MHISDYSMYHTTVIESFIFWYQERRNGAIANTHTARLAFNTPGSRVDREILAEVIIDRADMKVSANMKTPWKRATVDGMWSMPYLFIVVLYLNIQWSLPLHWPTAVLCFLIIGLYWKSQYIRVDMCVQRCIAHQYTSLSYTTCTPILIQTWHTNTKKV